MIEHSMSQTASQSPNTSNAFSSTSPSIIPPETPAETPQKQKFHIPKLVIILIIIYAVALYGFVGYMVLTKNNQLGSSFTLQPAPTPPKLPQLSESVQTGSGSANRFNERELTKMTVIDLTKHWSEWYRSDIPTEYTNLLVPKNIIEKVSAYRSNTFIYVAPKNWYGDVDISDIHGTASRLFPNLEFDESGPIIRTFLSDPNPMEGLKVASQFFPWMHERAAEIGLSDNTLYLTRIASISAVTPHLVVYSDVVGDAYVLRGAIFSNADEHIQDKQSQTIQMEVRLAKEEQEFADQLIDAFIQQYDLRNH